MNTTPMQARTVADHDVSAALIRCGRLVAEIARIERELDARRKDQKVPGQPRIDVTFDRSLIDGALREIDMNLKGLKVVLS